MLARRIVLLTAIIALHATPAWGQTQDLRQIKLQAQEDCLSGKTDSGVALLAKLYALTGQPNYIYNQGRCYEQAARPEDAINKFREYLRVAKNASASERADAEKHIVECRALKAEQDREKQAAAAAMPQPAPMTAVPPVAAPSAAANPVPEATPGALDLSARPSAAEPTPIYKTWWFWTGIGAVVAAGAVTAVLLLNRSSGACDGASHTCLGVK
jgi:hypothetical protein